jgi:tetratricopeptide (TPR) repeat protein
MAGLGSPVSVVVIYSRKDTGFLRELLDHLSPLEHQGIIELWHDQEIQLGEDWRGDIKERIKNAKIVLVLVSASCLASTYCQDEINFALELHRSNWLRVIPIKLHEVDWEGEPISELQALPKYGGSLSVSSNRNAEMAEIARAIRKLSETENPVSRWPETARKSEASNAGEANDQALAMAALFDLSAARSLLESAIRSTREVGDSDLAVLLSNYAHILRVAGELETARRILEEALALTASSDPALGIRLDKLAGILCELGEPVLAKTIAKRALRTSLRAHGHCHPAVAVRRNTLGLIWSQLGEPLKAIREFEKSISILLNYRHEGHHAVATVRGNLALALRARGDLQSALRHSKQALDDDRRTYHANHPAVATDLNTLGLILRDQGDSSAATRYLRRAQRIFSKIFGDLHPYTRAVRDNLRIAAQRVL